MSTCPFPHHKLRADLPPLTPNIAMLPIDERGYPVPWFVAWVQGKPEFRIADATKQKLAIAQRLCWICGQRLRGPKVFLIGPMCAINRVSAEPPSHPDCADWSVRGCPFLSKPQMVRREDDLTRANKGNVAGVMIDRNPGVCCLWTTAGHWTFNDGQGGTLFNIGEARAVSWWCQGRAATRQEIMHSIDTGLPILASKCFTEGDRKLLQHHYDRALPLIPA